MKDPTPDRLVQLESPYAGDVEANVEYGRRCMRDCFERQEAPFASHLLYTQEGVLDDDEPFERQQGMEAGWHWCGWADLVTVYVDRGISSGMIEGIKRAREEGKPIEYRSLEHGTIDAVDVIITLYNEDRLSEVLQ